MNKSLCIGTTLALAATLAAGCVVEDGEGEGEVVLSAECSWYGGVECQAACEDFEYHLACEGEMNAECAPECSEFEIEAGCTGSCEADCEADCSVDPGSFSCEGYCEAECGANCEAECEAHDNSAACQAECGAYCQGECELGCEAEPPDVDCSGSCEASCQGECTAEANIDCHFCDVDVYVDCSQEMNLDCQAGCDAEGVYECNGEFIDKGDVEAAIDYIESYMPDVEVTAEGDAECSGNACEAEGSCEMQCVAAGGPGSSSRGALSLLAVAAIGALLLCVRRRR